jgi:two-component system CheB/CheR fusion protein
MARKKSTKARKTGREGEPKAQRRPKEAPIIVGIGASAGGLEALKAFFAKVPPDSGVAFVVITHVQPDRKSLLPELLGSVTSIPIIESADEMVVEPNRIIVAKDSLLAMSRGALVHVKADGEPEASFHPIDHFFRALAADRKEQAIGVILSGSGNDGTLGLRSIKTAGGMVMAQEPQSAKYASMPESAIATGLVDYVLPPDKLPEALLAYIHRLQVAPLETLVLPSDAVQAILIRLRNHSGHDFTGYKKNTMARRIQRRMNIHHIDQPQQYVELLRESPRELDALLRELLISVTSFFRDPDAFEALGDKAVAEMLKSRDDSAPLRVWIPGCATGEEAYSVAIIIDEQCRAAGRANTAQIFATDLDQQAIETARAGVYPAGIASDVSRERLNRYFSDEGGGYRVQKSLRDTVVFAVQNMLSDPPFGHLDLIVCRNVLIYLDANAQQTVLPTFHYALRPGGMLFLGSAESAGSSSDLFQAVDARHRILRRRETAKPVHPHMAIFPRRVDRDDDRPRPPDGRGGPTLAQSIERVLLEHFVPCAALVDEKGTLCYLRGRSGLYLEPEQGEPRNNILEMARQGLGSVLATALRQAARKQEPVRRPGVRVRTNGDFTDVDVVVRPLKEPEALAGMLLVTLRPAEQPSPGGEAPEDGGHEELQRELRQTRENLQSTVEEMETSNEELKSSNEELQSTNEELQSTNEELETSKEEMQSLNEELNTVNAELESKVEALARANDDMTNLLNSMQVGTVFLDSELRVKRYTSKAQEVIRLIGTDVGRPLSDLTIKLKYDELMHDCRQVLATLAAREKEVQDSDGHWYLVSLTPYRTFENVINGVVITIVNIDRTKTAEAGHSLAVASRDFFEGIVRTVREPLMVLDEQLRIVLANDAFHRTFRTRPDEIDRGYVYKVADGQWDIPQLRELLEEILPRDKVMTDFRVEHDFPWIGRRAFMLNARRLQQAPGAPAMILLAFGEVQKEAG